MSTKPRIVGAVVSIAVILGAWRFFLPGPPIILNPATANGPLVERGVAMVMICGKDVGFRELQKNVPNAKRWSVLTREKRGECTVWFHYAASGSD